MASVAQGEGARVGTPRAAVEAEGEIGDATPGVRRIQRDADVGHEPTVVAMDPEESADGDRRQRIDVDGRRMHGLPEAGNVRCAVLHDVAPVAQRERAGVGRPQSVVHPIRNACHAARRVRGRE